MTVTLVPLQEHEKETFIRNIQVAFKKTVVEQFGPFDEEIIPRDHVTRSFDADGAESYNILMDGKVVGGTVLAIHPDTNRNELQLLFVNIDCHSKGIGYAAWQAIEALHPETEIWETFTPYFDQRNVHFYINKCGFHMVEFFCKAHPEPDMDYTEEAPGGDGFCRFEKKMK
ncbi:MAG: GNAT family N-acetyltransferase [Oscillospiraceae bacterium]|nr:GNAT family N-acetyltransferase [Oscillospiraceae bacterium]